MADEHETLVVRATQGDRPALDTLLERHLAGLQAFVRLRTGPVVRRKESSSDLVQSVCREVLQAASGFEYQGEAQFRSWLFLKALSKIQDRARYFAAEKRDPAREVQRHSDTSFAEYYTRITPSRLARSREDLARLEAAFDRLSEDHRQVITLTRIVGLSHREVAEQMDRTEDAVRVLLQRALARLSWYLSRDAFDE